MKTLALPELVIFDMDGLLFDTERLFQKTKGHVMEKYGFHQNPGDYERTLGTCGAVLHQILLDLYGPDYPADTVSQESRALVNAHILKEGPPVKKGIPTLLAWLQAQKIPCCVASSTRTDYVTSYIEKAGFSHYFSYIIGGDQVSHSKPDPEIFQKAAAHFHTDPAKALVLEDSENGIRAAANGNIPVICIPDLKQPDEKTQALTAACVSSADQVISLFACK